MPARKSTPPPVDAPTVLSTMTQAVLGAAKGLGISRKEILARAGVDSDALRSSPRIGSDVERRVWVAIQEVSGDPDIGVHVCEVDLKLRSLGPLALGAMTCATIDDGLRWTTKFLPLVREGTASSYLRGTFSEGPEAGRDPWLRPISESAMAVLVAYVRRWAGNDIVPIRVGFQHPKPDRTHELERFFGCPISFDQRTNFTTFAPEIGAMKPEHAEPELHAFIAETAAKELASLRASRSFKARLTEELGDVHAFDLATAARRLGVTARTLQRRLALEGTDYASLADGVRQRQALSMLEARRPIFEVSQHLGFSDMRAFRRAFRRWTGLSPYEFRARGVGS